MMNRGCVLPFHSFQWLEANGKHDDILQSCEKVDIVITTPGRLVEQIKNNPAFDIQDLQYLVVDEADKLLLQSYNNWIHVVCCLRRLLSSFTVDLTSSQSRLLSIMEDTWFTQAPIAPLRTMALFMSWEAFARSCFLPLWIVRATSICRSCVLTIFSCIQLKT